MIKNISQLILELKNKGIDLIKEQEYIKHPGMIGNMYEGLTTEILENTIFEGFNLKVVNGKIKNNSGGISAQIDCMIVVGDGDKLPYTESYIYHYSQVIAVIEVKKNLDKNQIISSYANLKSVIDVSRNADIDGELFMTLLHKSAWELLTNIEYPSREAIKYYPENLFYFYHTLFMEAFLPVRIVFGFFGYKNEYSFREGFISMLNQKIENGEQRGMGVGSFPNLIINGDYSLIKNNGMPYGVPFDKSEFYWHSYLSSNKNPIYHLIELIWTKLSFKFEIPFTTIFEDDINIKHYNHAFLSCKYDKDDKNKGWSFWYHKLTLDQLTNEFPEQKWEPAEINNLEFIVINLLCAKETLNFDDTDLIEILTEHKSSLKSLIEGLEQKRLIFSSQNKLKLSTRELVTIIKNGKMYAGENCDGQMSDFAFSN